MVGSVSVAVTNEGNGSCSRNCSGVMTESLRSVGGSMMPPELRRLTSDMLANKVSCKADTGFGWSTKLETDSGCTGSGCTSGAEAALCSFGGSGVMVGAGVVAGDDAFDDFEGRPTGLFVVPAAGLVAALVFVVRLAGALRLAVLLEAFCFSISRASCSSRVGILRVMRFRPVVKASMSLFSLSLAVTPLLV